VNLDLEGSGMGVTVTGIKQDRPEESTINRYNVEEVIVNGVI
jgi:hypothetical protein